MIKIGLDFDNTLVTYDSLFRRAAIEKNLIPNNFPANKKLIRQYLRGEDKEELFTILQGEVYGLRISEAAQSEGMFLALKNLKKEGISFYIISHKTKNPYSGPKYNLHNAAMKWLEKRENVFFEITKEKKIERIKSIGCTHFIDDLPEILDMINPNVQRIFYNPLENKNSNKQFVVMRNWAELNKLLENYD